MSNTPAPPANAAISIRTTLPNSKWLNATSPKSGQTINVGDQVVLCPKCYTPQLLQDWRDNDNACGVCNTPARVIERPTRGAAAPGATPAAGPAAAAAPATQAATPPPAAAAPVAAAAATVPPVMPAGPVDPYRYARVVDASPVSDVWRRNIMTISWILALWGIFVAVIYLFGLGPGV